MLYDKYFGGLGLEATGETRWFKIATPLYNEMDLAVQMRFRGMKEWSELPWVERRAWMYYHILANERRIALDDEQRREMEMEQKRLASLPQVEQGHGVRYR